MTDRSDAREVVMHPASGQRRRLRWEPRSDGRWTFTEAYHDGTRWVPAGQQIVDSVAFEGVPAHE